MLWKSRWSGGCPLKRVVDRPNCARIQDTLQEVLKHRFMGYFLCVTAFPPSR